MTWQLAIALYGVVLVALLVFGVGIGSVMGLVGILGITVASGFRLWPTIGDIVWNTTNSFTLVAVPLFVLMGEIILRSGVSKRFYSGLSTLMYGVRGGLAQRVARSSRRCRARPPPPRSRSVRWRCPKCASTATTTV